MDVVFEVGHVCLVPITMTESGPKYYRLRDLANTVAQSSPGVRDDCG